MLLHELKMPVKLRVWAEDGLLHLATCHHLDGMYSYCTMDEGGVLFHNSEGNINTFHLSRHTPMILIDGRYQIED